jgi:6-phosphogluconolactonase (cycloisomerase 2 family)
MNQQARGFVYVQTNDANVNEVVVYRRTGDGRLDRLGSYLTGGKGSGKPHLPSQSSVVLAGGRLFVTNAGTNDITVFALRDDALDLLDRAPSGGSAPTSVAVHGEHVYVLNTGDEPNVTGFLIGEAGRVTPMPGSTRPLGSGSDPAQVAFSPDGRTLLVTDRALNSIHAFAIADGIAQAPTEHPSSGATPYGFDFTVDGTVIVTEAAGAEVGKASASSYKVSGGGELEPVSGAIPSTRSEVCWAVVSRDGRTVFVTNFGDGTISTYAIAEDGSIELREAVAATTIDGQPGLRDEALSADGRYLYALHADAREVFAWEVGQDGTLTALGSANGLPATAAGLAAS